MPTSLQLEFDAIQAELSSMKTITRPFMEPSADGRFDSLINNLKMIQQGGAGHWNVPLEKPLETLPSKEYEKNGSVAFPVYGSIAWTWGIKAVGSGRRNRLPTVFEVNGIASAHLHIRKKEDKSILAEWKTELGAIDSPGCYFHASINSKVCVPRVPSLFVTPMDAFEFLLGELFQTTWPEYASSSKHDVLYWRSKQTKLLSRVLQWKLKKVEKMDGSPWVALKHAKPEAEDGLFVSSR